ncbi:hypothetical protein [Halobacteroides halobius]|nr:hypothetical protein [Halobacteroides halobius]
MMVDGGGEADSYLSGWGSFLGTVFIGGNRLEGFIGGYATKV